GFWTSHRRWRHWHLVRGISARRGWTWCGEGTGFDRLGSSVARTGARGAGKLLAGVELGADPAAAVAAERAALLFQKAAEAYIKEHVRAKRKSSTADLYDGFLHRHIAPHLGSK